MQNIGDVEYYLLMYVRCLLTCTQALTFALPSEFSFRNIKEAIALVSSSFVIVLGSTGKKVFISWICERSAVTDFTP